MNTIAQAIQYRDWLIQYGADPLDAIIAAALRFRLSLEALAQ